VRSFRLEEIGLHTGIAISDSRLLVDPVDAGWLAPGPGNPLIQKEFTVTRRRLTIA